MSRCMWHPLVLSHGLSQDQTSGSRLDPNWIWVLCEGEEGGMHVSKQQDMAKCDIHSWGYSVSWRQCGIALKPLSTWVLHTFELHMQTKSCRHYLVAMVFNYLPLLQNHLIFKTHASINVKTTSISSVYVRVLLFVDTNFSTLEIKILPLKYTCKAVLKLSILSWLHFIHMHLRMYNNIQKSVLSNLLETAILVYANVWDKHTSINPTIGFGAFNHG